jgi:DNA polymerase elongation subunit (family B)
MTSIHQILFLDVETVSQHPSFDGLNEHGQHLWHQKIGFMARRGEHPWSPEDYANSYKDRAAIYAEFGKVIVISAGIITPGENHAPHLRIKSFFGNDEKEVLQSFVDVLEKNFDDPNVHVLCGHNIREFDIPYLCRRLTVHNIELPVILNLSGKKPWEVKFVADTLELWKFGDHKNFTSLDLLAFTLGIPSPKENLDGSKVGQCYWEENDLLKIKQYCERDVVTVAQVFLRLQNQPLLSDNQIVITN